ncbi:hypothetical protein HDU89_007587 [Geranomyces variabilis]|nr:hypothetical protein HDU89_007587 [Geranomyces variabilis]
MSTTFAWAEYPSGDNFGIAVTGINNLVVEIVNGEMELRQTLAFLSDALKTVSPHTVIYIVQRADGTLVGSTVDPVVYIPPTNATKPAIINVNTTTNAFVNLTQNYLQQKLGALNNIPAVTQASISDAVAGITYLVTVTPLQDGKNLDWRIILGAPEMQTTATSSASSPASSSPCVVAATGYVYIAVVRPLHQLCDAMRKAQNFDFSSIAKGTFTTSPSFLREVYESQKAFYDMTAKLAMAFKANRSLAMGGQSSQGARPEGSKTKLGASAQTVPLLSPT